jgi:hypothetical protein
MSAAPVLAPEEAVQQADSNVESVNIASAQQHALELWNADRAVFGRSQESAKALGEALVAVKNRMDHGEYIPWLKRAGIDRNRASYCVRVVTGKHAKTRATAKKKRKVVVLNHDTFVRWRDDEQVFTVSGRPLLGEEARWVLDLMPAPPDETEKEPAAPAVVEDAPLYEGPPKIEFDADELNKALRRFKAINPVMDERSAVYITSPATVELVGTESGLRIRLPKAQTFGVFTHTVDFENLVAAMKSMTGAVTLMDDGTLKAGDFQTKMTWAPDNAGYCFPDEEPLPDTTVDGVNLARFKEQYKLVNFAIPNPDGKFVVPTALLEATPGNLRMVTTDGVRVVIADQAARVLNAEPQPIEHPALDLVHEMNGTTLSITGTPNLQMFTTELETLTYGKRHSEFPKYRRVIPANHDGWAHLTCPDSAGLVSALKRLRPHADSEKPCVIFEVADDGRLSLTAIKYLDGPPTAHAAVPILKVGPSVCVRLDAKMLLPFLERVGAFECYIKDAHTIVDFQARDGYRFLMMPMREPTPTAAPVQEKAEAVTP